MSNNAYSRNLNDGYAEVPQFQYANNVPQYQHAKVPQFKYAPQQNTYTRTPPAGGPAPQGYKPQPGYASSSNQGGPTATPAAGTSAAGAAPAAAPVHRQRDPKRAAYKEGDCLYGSLGLDESARDWNPVQLQSVIRKIWTTSHPDGNPRTKGINNTLPAYKRQEEEFKHVDKANQVLRDEKKRWLYDNFGYDTQNEFDAYYIYFSEGQSAN
ncbi:hypothetical protein M011DRAFT_529328 [Sporormia fimetaria CBS 119925]|uniref:J domain-containing protein n=1 Tax=Sporormia fimetaria CBS 119925 TaxID=1340428 RepID=A0A6A6V222_9PLEO|nr:hypothetical protein M011DRAFT_529328 [Sporormia fimetaria CBS 119925]